MTVTPPASAESPDAADGEECDSSDDQPHDDVVHSAPPFCFAERTISPDAAHYALSTFPCLLEIQRKSNSAPAAVTPHRLIAAEVPFELSFSKPNATITLSAATLSVVPGPLKAPLLRFYYNLNLIAPDLRADINYAQ